MMLMLSIDAKMLTDRFSALCIGNIGRVFYDENSQVDV